MVAVVATGFVLQTREVVVEEGYKGELNKYYNFLQVLKGSRVRSEKISNL